MRKTVNEWTIKVTEYVRIWLFYACIDWSVWFFVCFFYIICCLLDVTMPFVTNELMRDGEKTVNLRIQDIYLFKHSIFVPNPNSIVSKLCFTKWVGLWQYDLLITQSGWIDWFKGWHSLSASLSSLGSIKTSITNSNTLGPWNKHYLFYVALFSL